jgi:cysteine rich repeat protein
MFRANQQEAPMRGLRLHAVPRLAALAMLLASGFAAGADAQQPTQEQANAIRQSCRSDYQARCSSVAPGGTAALQCLKDNIATLSPACQSAVAATQGAAAPSSAARPPAAAASPPPAMSPREEAGMMRRACGGDFRAYCQGVGLGGGRALACLADHRESLSPPCREALASMQRP